MVSQEVVQTEFSVVHGLTRMHGLTRNEDTSHFKKNSQSNFSVQIARDHEITLSFNGDMHGVYEFNNMLLNFYWDQINTLSFVRNMNLKSMTVIMYSLIHVHKYT